MDPSLQPTEAIAGGASALRPPGALSHPDVFRIPGYTIHRLLGRGGMADVYLGEQVSLSRPVAIKVLRPEFFSDEGFRKRFRAVESTVGGALVHPCIVTVFDGGIVDERAYLVMEYLDGGALTDRLDTPLPPAEAKSIAIRIAQALAFAHARSIIHRDVKPANILFRADGTAVLADFGIAKLVNEEATTQLTGTGVILGSVSYMSPEQVEGKPVDHRADLYSLGIVLFLMLSGRLPFDSTNPVQTAVSHATAPIPRLPPDVAAYQPIIDRLLAKRPEHRIQTAQELVTRLQCMPERPDATLVQTRPLTRLARPQSWLPELSIGRGRAAMPLAVTGLAVLIGTWMVLLRLSVGDAPGVQPLAPDLQAPPMIATPVADAAGVATDNAAVEPSPPDPAPAAEPPIDTSATALAPVDDPSGTLADTDVEPSEPAAAAPFDNERAAAAAIGGLGPGAPLPPAVFLSVHAVPEQARIRIMNIVPPYEDGIALDPGAYDLEVSAPGYLTYRRWHRLEAGEQEITVELTPRPPEPPPPRPLRDIQRFFERILP